jgi:hypothetical protein
LWVEQKNKIIIDVPLERFVKLKYLMNRAQCVPMERRIPFYNILPIMCSSGTQKLSPLRVFSKIARRGWCFSSTNRTD